MINTHMYLCEKHFGNAETHDIQFLGTHPNTEDTVLLAPPTLFTIIFVVFYSILVLRWCSLLACALLSDKKYILSSLLCLLPQDNKSSLTDVLS